MRRIVVIPSLAAACLLLITAGAQAEVKVTISKSHLCCPMCFKAVDETLKDLEGVKHETSREEKTITITAEDEKKAQAAIDALAKAGFHGKHPSLKPDDLLSTGTAMKFTTDFRSVYATVLEKWLRISSEAALGQKWPLVDCLA